MTDSLSFSNESQEHLNSWQEHDFANKTIDDILSTLDNSIVDKANKLMKIKECKENYKTKTNIIDDPKKSIREIRTMEPLVLEKKEDISFLGKEKPESIINKAIIMKHIPRIRRFYKDKKIPENNIVIKANMNEIMNGLNSSNLRNNQLSNIGKILRWTRYNFSGIILEEGESGETIIQKGSEYLITEEKNPKESIIKKWERVFFRHLEWDNVSPEIMETALKNGIAFYEEYFKNEYFADYKDDKGNEVKGIKYIKSGSWLRNREFRKFYKEKIWDKDPNKSNNIQETLTRMENKWTIFVSKKEENEEKRKENNDRFLRIPLHTPTSEDKHLSSKEIDEKLENIEKWLNEKKLSNGKIVDIWEKITMDNINPEIVLQLIQQRDKDKTNDKVRINWTIIARILRWKPIESGICLLPIENFKKN
jgi:hypothetical protein